MVLKETWINHAFPDLESGKNDIVLDDTSSRQRELLRKEIYIEQTTNFRMRRHTSDDDQSPAGRRTAKSSRIDDLMLLAVGSPAYIEAYNYQVTFTLNGVETEMTQGWLYEFAKRHREDLRTQIDEGRKKGIGIEEMALLQSKHDTYQVIEDNANPQRGEMTLDRWQKIQTVFDENEEISRTAERELGAMSDPNQSAEIGNFDASQDDSFSNLSQQGNRTSFAGQIDSVESTTMALSGIFQESAIGLPDETETGPAAPTPNKITGLGL